MQIHHLKRSIENLCFRVKGVDFQVRVFRRFRTIDTDKFNKREENMPATQTSENEQRRVSIREQAARLVNILPNNFAVLMLRFLGFERPKLSKYYLEIDHAIQTYLQKKLEEFRYSDVIPKSLGRDDNNQHSPRFAYGYLLVYMGKKRHPTFINGYILGAQQRLIGINQTNVEFDPYPPKNHIYARVNVDNYLFVAKARSEK